MTDFSPHNVKVAANRIAARIASGDIADFSPLSTGEIEATDFGCIVRARIGEDGKLDTIRVIDANGRHWFPEVASQS